MTKEEFIAFVAKIAVKDWRDRRIMLPSVVIAQACKESAFGTSELAVKANALFGIKLNGWTGKSYRKKADEQNADGTMRTDPNALWRAYESWEQSIVDHNTYIRDRKVGNQSQPNFLAIIGETNVKKVLAGFVGNTNRQATADRCTDNELRQYVLDGKSVYPYATGLNYPQSMLDDYIKRYDLTQYDKESDKMRILLISGHGAGDSGATAKINGVLYKEAEETIKIVELLNDKLMQYADVECYPFSRNAYKDACNGCLQVNFKDYDYVLEIHFNACVKDLKGNGKTTGTEIYVTRADNTTAVEQLIVNNVASIGLKNRGVRRANYSVINKAYKASAESALLEICFIDDADDMAVYLADRARVADAIANGLIYGLNLTKTSISSSGTEKQQNGANTEATAVYNAVGTNAETPFFVKPLYNLNIRTAPKGKIVFPDTSARCAKKGVVYTIIQVQGSWGFLKSKAGWINISSKYVKRV